MTEKNVSVERDDPSLCKIVLVALGTSLVTIAICYVVAAIMLVWTLTLIVASSHLLYFEILLCDSTLTSHYCLYENYTASNCAERHDSFYPMLIEAFKDGFTAKERPRDISDLGRELVNNQLNHASGSEHDYLDLVLNMYFPFDELFMILDIPFAVNKKVLQQCGLK